MKGNHLYLAVALIFLAVVSRLIPHPANFTPVMAVALFGGAIFKGNKWFFAIPLVALFISDIFLGFHDLSWLVYSCFIAVGFLGLSLYKSLDQFSLSNVKSVGIKAFVASVLFFVVSNLGVFFTSSLYPFSFVGLTECFSLAIPFFHNTLISTLAYSFALFAGYSVVGSKLKKTAYSLSSPS